MRLIFLALAQIIVRFVEKMVDLICNYENLMTGRFEMSGPVFVSGIINRLTFFKPGSFLG